MRYVCTHSVPPGSVSLDQLKQLADAAQNDATVRGVRSFSNLSKGKAVCVIDAPDQQSLVAWFRKMNLPFDSITPLEYESDGGNIIEVMPQHAAQV